MRLQSITVVLLAFCVPLAVRAAPRFVAKPVATKSDEQVKIEFAVSERTDVAVFIEDAHGRIVRHLVAGVLSGAKAALAEASPADLLKCRRIQGFDVTGMQAIFESVAHFRGHTQEIVHVTRIQLGDDYEFAFVPKTPEQGAAQE